MSSVDRMERPSDLELMMYTDGELEPARAREVEAYLAREGDAIHQARSVVAGVRGLGEAVRTYLELETDRAEEEVPAFGALWSGIEHRLHANGTTDAAAVRVGDVRAVEADAAGERPAHAVSASRDAARSGGLWATLSAWLSSHRSHMVTGLVSAGAVAALMMLIRPHDRVVEHMVRPGVVNAPTPASAPPARSGKLKSELPEVEDLEVYDGSGTILTIAPQGDDDSAATVIWISSDDEKNREGPL